MFKDLLKRFRRDRVRHQATLLFEFGSEDQVAWHLVWHRPRAEESQTEILVLFFYARILYELADLNKAKVARELMAYLEQVNQRLLDEENRPVRPRLPLGDLKVVEELAEEAQRRYRVEFFELPEGKYRLDFEGSLGKENFYLPAIFLVFLSSCLEHLDNGAIKRLAQRIGRLHAYYRYRRDFWEGAALTAGPLFALGAEKLPPEETPAI